MSLTWQQTSVVLSKSGRCGRISLSWWIEWVVLQTITKYELTTLCATGTIHHSSVAAAKVWLLYSNLQPSQILVYIITFLKVTKNSPRFFFLIFFVLRKRGNYKISKTIWKFKRDYLCQLGMETSFEDEVLALLSQIKDGVIFDDGSILVRQL